MMLDQTVVIPNATPRDIYRLLLDSKQHADLIGAKAEIDPRIGGRFETFEGYAIGTTTKLVPYRCIEQTWRASDWPKEHFSTITFNFEETDNATVLRFQQTRLPSGTRKEFEKGWQDNYWQPLIDYFSSDKKQ